MNRNGHLENYTLTLTTKAPLFIGSGKTAAKTDYVLSPDGKDVLRLDMPKLFLLLAERGLADKYEAFIMRGGTDMYRFLTETCGIGWDEVEKLTQYRVDAAGALDTRHSLKDIHLFNRDTVGNAYVPGSSVKGAFRTAFLFDKIDADKNRPPVRDDEKLKKSEINEARYVNTLHYVRDNNNKTAGKMLSSLFQGVRISDSAPIDHSRMMLADKIDSLPDGSCHKLNVCRECVRPGTAIEFVLTIDRSVVGDQISPETLTGSLARFSRYYEKKYLKSFETPEKAAEVSIDGLMLLGGGAGFFSKSLAYPCYGSRAATMVQDFMAEKFRRHRHGNDLVKYGISPRTMKYAMYEGRLYPMGLCEVSIK